MAHKVYATVDSTSDGHKCKNVISTQTHMSHR